MFKTLIAGFILGAAAAGAALYFLPVVNQAREFSLISVMPNGGNSEIFYANIPTDRIMIGAPNQATPLPAGLEWPADKLFANARVELFKIRSSNDVVSCSVSMPFSAMRTILRSQTGIAPHTSTVITR